MEEDSKVCMVGRVLSGRVKGGTGMEREIKRFENIFMCFFFFQAEDGIRDC